ncbi:MAG: VWA domain-containing protein [Actinomycetota bacterium]|nr:VWA domain-containing protein [Actinomycetota bacterium]
MLDVVTGFVAELRAAGLPVALTESIDALAAVRHVDLGSRAAFKSALAATLVKRQDHRPTFDTVFEIWFASPAPGDAIGMADHLDADGPRTDPPAPDDSALAAMVAQAIAGGDAELLATLARLAVDRFAGMDTGRPVGAAYHLHQAWRRLDTDGALARLLGAARADDDQGSAGLELRLRGDEYRANMASLRGEVEAEVRRRLVAERGSAAVARSLRRPLPEDVDFMHATREEMAAMRRTLLPLSRRLAVRLARRRRHRRHGSLDFRSTVRHSLSSGGVPVEPRFKHRRPSKPEIVVVADVSGSVATFARFTLQFVHALSSQFSRVRSFVFIDGIDEVTRLFEGSEDLAHAIQRVNTEADVIWAEGHSDYGHALGVFAERWGTELTNRTTVVVLGDARNNYHDPAAWAVAEVAGRARHLWWLNPEPQSYWDTGDSVISDYAGYCDGVFECRNLRQLERFVERIG